MVSQAAPPPSIPMNVPPGKQKTLDLMILSSMIAGYQDDKSFILTIQNMTYYHLCAVQR